MNLDEIKEIIQKEGGKIIIVENDKPQMVIMSFDAWKREKSVQTPKGMEARAPESSKASFGGETSPEGLTIDDLPL